MGQSVEGEMGTFRIFGTKILTLHWIVSLSQGDDSLHVYWASCVVKQHILAEILHGDTREEYE